MWFRIATGALVLLGILVGASSAHALNILSLDPTTPTAGVGESLQLTLEMSFSDTTVGGGVTLSFDDTVLMLTSILFDGALGDDSDFRCPTAGLPGSVSCPADPNFISFGDFGGLSGDRTVATILFEVLDPPSSFGLTMIDLLAERSFSDTVGSPLAVSLAGASVNVVPEPGTFALLGFGMAGLAVRRRRSRR